MRIGFIGLGLMGSAMAGRLCAAGHEMVCYNRTREKTTALAAAGARVAETPAEAAAGAEIAITMLGTDEALRAVALGGDGIAAAMPPGAVHAAMGTHGIEACRALAAAHDAAGGAFVAAPVLGRPDAAAAGEIAILVGGPEDAAARLRPLFDIMGRVSFSAGPAPETAAAIKIAFNFVLGCAIEAMGEGFALIRRHGVDPAMFYEVLTDRLFDAPAHRIYGDIISREDYDRVGLTARLGLKDANLALAAAEAVNMPLPSGNAWRDRLLGAIAHGHGARDWSVVALEQARASGIE